MQTSPPSWHFCVRYVSIGNERNTVIALRNEEAMNDEVLRRLQRDIDPAEARLQRRR
jgi:hypothetical protein